MSTSPGIRSTFVDRWRFFMFKFMSVFNVCGFRLMDENSILELLFLGSYSFFRNFCVREYFFCGFCLHFCRQQMPSPSTQAGIEAGRYSFLRKHCPVSCWAKFVERGVQRGKCVIQNRKMELVPSLSICTCSTRVVPLRKEVCLRERFQSVLF